MDNVNIDTYVGNNIKMINSRIVLACDQSNRNVKTIKLLAISKRKGTPFILAAYKQGIKDFGENYLQEAIQKIDKLPNDIRWHYTGSIQSNKLKIIAKKFSWVHTVSSLSHIQKLDQYRPPNTPPINICIQININNEQNKSGLILDNLEELDAILKNIKQYKYVKLKGLMCIPNQENSYTIQSQNFKKLYEIKNQLNKKYHLKLTTLSMGMSNDLEAAIHNGSTIIRIGTAIFGSRN